ADPRAGSEDAALARRGRTQRHVARERIGPRPPRLLREGVARGARVEVRLQRARPRLVGDAARRERRQIVLRWAFPGRLIRWTHRGARNTIARSVGKIE